MFLCLVIWEYFDLKVFQNVRKKVNKQAVAPWKHTINGKVCGVYLLIIVCLSIQVKKSRKKNYQVKQIEYGIGTRHPAPVYKIQQRCLVHLHLQLMT